MRKYEDDGVITGTGNITSQISRQATEQGKIGVWHSVVDSRVAYRHAHDLHRSSHFFLKTKYQSGQPACNRRQK